MRIREEKVVVGGEMIEKKKECKPNQRIKEKKEGE